MPGPSHRDQVRRIVEQLQAVEPGGPPLELTKSSASHFVPNPHKKGGAPTVDLSGLERLLEIDEQARTCTAQSGLTFSDLVRATLARGLIPMTVPELKTITIGGAVSGCSVESMSYEHGGFFDSCLQLEVITGTGEVLTCSRENERELFEMLHGSYGVLGIISKLTFRLLAAKPYVRMTYRRFTTFDDFWRELRERCKAGDFDFVDAIIHGRDLFVVCLGQMVDAAPKTNSYAGSKVFYKSTRHLDEDHLTTYDYFFRYDADCHWLTRSVPPLENGLVRALLGRWFLGSSNLIAWSRRLRPLLKMQRRPDVVVDVFIPAKRFDDFFRWYETDFDFYPLWIVPYQMEAIYPWLDDAFAKEVDDTFMIDCAVYGKKNNHPQVDYSQLIERKVFELRGVKTLISRNHYDEETFWTIYAKDRFDLLKARFDPQGLFGSLYERFAPQLYER